MDLFKLLQNAFENEEKIKLDQEGLLDLYKDTRQVYDDSQGYGLRGNLQDMWKNIDSQVAPSGKGEYMQPDQFKKDSVERNKQLRIQQLLDLEKRKMLQPDYGPKDAERYINSTGHWM